MEWLNVPSFFDGVDCNKQCNTLCRDKYACGIKVCSGHCGDYTCMIFIG